MRRGWALLSTVSVLLLVALAGLALGQTQPEVEVEPVTFGEPLTPDETTWARVNATVSCEGWGQPGGRTVAVFGFPEGPDSYMASFRPNETQLPSSVGCPPGETVTVATELGLEPTHGAPAGQRFQAPVEVVLEERMDGQTVDEHGPYNASARFATAFVPIVDVRPAETGVEAAPGGAAEIEFVVRSLANGPAQVHLHAADVEGVDVRVKAGLLGLQPGEEERVPVVVEDRGLHPFSERLTEITVDARLSDATDPDDQVLAAQQTSVPVTFQPWYEDLARLGALLAATLAATGASLLALRRDVDPEQARQPSPDTIASTSLLVLGAIGLLWGTVLGPAGLVVGGPLLAAGAYLRLGGRLPGRVREPLAAMAPDGLGFRALAAGLASFLLAAVLDLYALWMVAGLALIAGAWLLWDAWLPGWASKAFAAFPILFAIAPWFQAGLTVGVAGDVLARFPVAESLVELVGVWSPFLLALSALLVRARGTARLAAGMGVVAVVASGLVPAWVWVRLGGTTDLAADVTVTAPLLVAVALAGALALHRGVGTKGSRVRPSRAP